MMRGLKRKMISTLITYIVSRILYDAWIETFMILIEYCVLPVASCMMRGLKPLLLIILSKLSLSRILYDAWIETFITNYFIQIIIKSHLV